MMNTKIVKRVLFMFGLALLFLPAVAYGIARGYTTNDSGLQVGMVVAININDNSGNSVERATQNSTDRVVGVVTTINQSLVTVSSGNAKVLVENEGEVEAYVSDLQGVVSKGDPLVLSPLKGILMKQADSQGRVIGIATDNPDNSSTYSYDDNGTSKQTQISQVKINLSQIGSQNSSAPESSTLSKLGKAIVGHEVSGARVLVALAIFITVLIAEGGIIYGAVSSTITALGRNPLAKGTIRNELWRVVAVAVLVLIIGLASVYVVLRI